MNNQTNERISYITEDNNKNLWIGTYGLGVYRIDLISGEVIHQEFTRDENDDWQIDRLPNDWISCILTDRSGLIWIGTYNGLACYDTRRNTFINFTNRNNILPGYPVYILAEDPENRIWIGTTEGLFCFDRRDESYKHYTTGEGLPENVICGLATDQQGNI
ncbi:MAG: hypothetical protein LUD15_13570 [Bacteroides sp.]|nr:hypothetical protein [Bacteroides sp.]